MTITALTGIFQGADVEDGGKFKVFGSIKTKGTPPVPAYAKVNLHDRLSGRLVRSQWTNPVTGAYQFSNIRNGDFYVVAFDPLKNWWAVAADQLVPEAM